MRFLFLKQRYARFIARHGLTRHFTSRAIWDHFAHVPAARRSVPESLARRLQRASLMDSAELLVHLRTSEQGLPEPVATRIRRRVGINEVARETPLPAYLHLLHCYLNPFNLLLTLMALVSWLNHEARATVVIGVMVLLSSVMRFIQESRGSRAADLLKAAVDTEVTVVRPGSPEGLPTPMRALVPGDVVTLSAGDMVPADLRVLAAKDFFVAQAAMTGEAFPVEKFPVCTTPADSPLACDNLVFMGTSVVSGAARAVVLETGSRSYFGVMAESLAARARPPGAFQVSVNAVSWLLIRVMLVMAPLVFLINGWSKGDWPEAMLFALAVAVGLTPEMLPMIVTATLTSGAVLLSRKKVIIKRLDALYDFGAMNVLCTDKTGTLTQDRIYLSRHIDAAGQDSDAVLSLAYLNSHYQTGLKNLLDRAVLEHAHKHAELGIDSHYRKIDEIPFDFDRKRMSVVVAAGEATHQLICKGALEEVLAVCARVRQDGADQPLDAPLLADVRTRVEALNHQGLRVVAVAVKDTPTTQQVYGVNDETGLTLMGFIAFLDPPKESTAPALKALSSHGVEVKILTGDNEFVAACVCGQVGLPARGVVLGHEIDTLSDDALAETAARATVFARLSPLHKARIVRVLRSRGNVVGFLGDGINDAPALHAADIGISVDSGTDIAKEAADIILLEKSLGVLDDGVIEGRRTFANMGKYIKMTASSNFGNVLSVLLASAFLPFLPMLPLHMLVQNLLYDLSQIAIPFDSVDPEALATPHRWQVPDLARFMVCFGPLSSLFDGLTFVLLWFVFSANTAAVQTVFQSGWFVEGVLSQMLVVQCIRTRRVPIVQSRPATAVWLVSLVVMTVAIYLPMGGLAQAFNMTPLPGAYFAYLAGVLLMYLTLAQALKAFYARRWGWV